jgi:ABC-2 type transport system permease protein
VGVTTSLVGLVVMMLLASAAFGLSFLSYGAAILPFLLVLFLSGIALGIAGSALVLRLGPASEWLIWPIPSVLSPFVGVFYPLSPLPGWMQAIGRALAPSYVFEGLRAIVAGKAPQAGQLAIGAGLSVVYLVLACWVFASVYRYAIRTGLIARYSAETVT